MDNRNLKEYNNNMIKYNNINNKKYIRHRINKILDNKKKEELLKVVLKQIQWNYISQLYNKYFRKNKVIIQKNCEVIKKILTNYKYWICYKLNIIYSILLINWLLSWVLY